MFYEATFREIFHSSLDLKTYPGISQNIASLNILVGDV